MSIVMIGKWGKNAEGIHTYSINATTKEEIYQILDAVKEQGGKYWETPNITYKARTYHVLLRFYIPSEVGYPEESSM